MAPRVAAIRQTCCCFNVRIATTALAVYHVVSVQAARDTVCVCVCEGGPDLWRPLEREDCCSPPPLGTLDKSLTCSGPWAPSLSKAGEGTLQQGQEWEAGSLF